MDYLGFDEVRYGADTLALVRLRFEAPELHKLVEALEAAGEMTELCANLREILEAVDAA